MVGCVSPEALEALDPVVELIENRRTSVRHPGALIIGISGIDGSGKSYLGKTLKECLISAGHEVALIGVDDWLHPDLDHSQMTPRDFYERGVRFARLFEDVIKPLREHGSASVEICCGDPAGAQNLSRFAFSAVEIVLVEGIFLFQERHSHHFDLKIWIECSFETALERAIARGQEGLSAGATRQAFERLYFPAQRLHFEQDHPQKIADYILLNE